jgi:hypothetical protein
MFDGLDRVPWRVLGYAYSGKADIPSLLRALLDQETAAEAADELLNELYHQGGFVCSAAVAALPFLVEAAESGRVRCRCEVLEIVGRLAAVAREVAPRWIAEGWAEAWERAVSRLLALLADDDPGVRRAVTLVLEETVSAADQVVHVICDMWPTQDRVTRLDQVLAVGSLARSLTAAVLPEALVWLRDRTGDADEQLRFAATLALRRALPGHPVPPEPIITGLSGDLTAWAGSEQIPSTPAWAVRWAINRLSDDVGTVEEICLALVTHSEPGRRQGAVTAAADLLSVSRRPQRRLLPALRERAADPDLEVQTRALHLLAAHARPGCQDADLFTEHLDAPASAPRLPAIAEVAVWGLAWSADERCLPDLMARLEAEHPGFPLFSTHAGKAVYPMWTPSLRQILAPCSRWAATLLPAMLRRLRPGVETDLGRTLLQTLDDWGPAAAPAAPHITGLLTGRLRHWAAEALGAIGPEAASAEKALRELLRDPQAGLDQAAAEAIPWAYWRVTGDPEPALEMLGSRLGDRHTATRRLADLGPHAARYVSTLRVLAKALDPWTALEAAHALIRITGDVKEGAHILIRPIADLLDGKPMPIARAAARYLTEIDDTLPGHLATIKAALADDRRHSWNGGWAAIHDDLELRALLHTSITKPRPKHPQR